MLAGSRDVASIRAAAIPPAVVLPVSDMRGHAGAANARTRGRTKAGVALVFTSDVLFASRGELGWDLRFLQGDCVRPAAATSTAAAPCREAVA